MMAQETNADEALTERLIFPVSKRMLEQINDYRFEHRCESKSEAIRRLIEAGLKATEKAHSHKK
jgi:hypothetical protein